ncbi:hypothetical protein B0H14DRAFT_2580667 [Mycena olivaceomarginata]|nr:hypothetical protein B0H14DRAFT_2580667 [Mycena olivaceomarginata]
MLANKILKIDQPVATKTDEIFNPRRCTGISSSSRCVPDCSDWIHMGWWELQLGILYDALFTVEGHISAAKIEKVGVKKEEEPRSLSILPPGFKVSQGVQTAYCFGESTCLQDPDPASASDFLVVKCKYSHLVTSKLLPGVGRRWRYPRHRFRHT